MNYVKTFLIVLFVFVISSQAQSLSTNFGVTLSGVNMGDDNYLQSQGLRVKQFADQGIFVSGVGITNVRVLADLTGNGFIAEQTVLTNMPAIVTGGNAGTNILGQNLTGIYFHQNSGNTHLKMDRGASLFSGTGTPFTVILALNSFTNNNNRCVIGLGYSKAISGVASRIQVQPNSVSLTTQGFFANCDTNLTGNTVVASGTTTTTNVPKYLTFIYDGVSRYTSLDGLRFVGSTIPGTADQQRTHDLMTLGAMRATNALSGNFSAWNGMLYRNYIFSNALTGVTLTNVINYINSNQVDGLRLF